MGGLDEQLFKGLLLLLEVEFNAAQYLSVVESSLHGGHNPRRQVVTKTIQESLQPALQSKLGCFLTSRAASLGNDYLFGATQQLIRQTLDFRRVSKDDWPASDPSTKEGVV